MNEKGKFWMVYCEGGGSPKQKHDTVSKAILEAKRITQKEGKATYVLVSIGYCEIPVPEPVYTSFYNKDEKLSYVLGGEAGAGFYRKPEANPPF
jgi:hypothetical protein